MTPEQLLKPRYKVIADYPGNDAHDVGDIIYPNTLQSDYKNYPHLFEELPWYADRKPEEMPEYVNSGGQIFKVRKWLIDKNGYWLSLDYPNASHTLGNSYFPTVLPATLDDYNQYLYKK